MKRRTIFNDDAVDWVFRVIERTLVAAAVTWVGAFLTGPDPTHPLSFDQWVGAVTLLSGVGLFGLNLLHAIENVRALALPRVLILIACAATLVLIAGVFSVTFRTQLGASSGSAGTQPSAAGIDGAGRATPSTVPEWQAFYYPDIQGARGRSISQADLNSAPKFKTLQNCVAWGREHTRQVVGSGFQCATGCEFNEIARDVICQDSSPILP